ncbi:pilus assembly protein [Simiduia aestuariiviva]|uniref:Type IV pilus assembly protein PilY1 n=1 Tax=Simiduia aestuariiviva TaxID=1510459 RepID=A0A839UXS3_9GAMM|nr:PilC/PilY family type IV pilus protein [Simiduia aestuariiviva]MBB3170125.1 type IV pilus assembly protein PilY1 [Simiduia aestuariiviva]
MSKFKLATFCGVTAYAWACAAAAAPVALSEVPLAVSGSAKPNIMFLIDNSGSMAAIVEGSGAYDSAVTYGSCSGTFKVASFDYAGKDGSNRVYLRSGGTWYRWADDATDNSGGGGRCFGATDTYVGYLDGGFGSYSGNYLNWYFSNADQSGGDNFGASQRKPGTLNRIEVARASIKSVIGTSSTNGLTKMNVGLAGFVGTETNSTNKADIKKQLVDVDANRAALLTAVDTFNADQWTPLGTALATLGRYFVEGSDQPIVLKSEYIDKTEDSHDVFSREPQYSDGSAPSTSPIQYSCQKNFIITMTDGAPTNDSGYSDDLGKWSDNTLSHTEDASLADTDSGDFDDIAEALYETDLRPDLEGVNNISSYTIGFAIDLPLLKRAADNAGGEYFIANDATALVDSLNNIATSVKAQVGSVASVAFNSSQLSSDSAVYQAKYNTARWSGSLIALPLSDTGSIQPEAWDAATEMDSQAPSSRNIITKAADGVVFDWANLSDAQKDDLGYNGSGTRDDALGQRVLNYLRGDRTNEGSGAGKLRARSSVLGDIVNSTPVFVGKPELFWPDYLENSKFGSSTNSYSDFKAGSAKNRQEVIYFGANDGMLHGVDASISGATAGQEVMAYIPTPLFDDSGAKKGLHYLADQNYAHKFYVDLTPSVADVFVKTSPTAARDWSTVLIGGLRAGGRGLFALDITDPTRYSNMNLYADDVVMWEFTADDDADLGYTYSQPSIAMMQNGKWAVIVGNGYNSTGDGRAKLFIIYIEEGVDGTWSATDYKKIDTEVGDLTTPNGLSTPRLVDLDGDKVVDRIYAGDLRGNMWAFDVDGSNAGNWDVAYSQGATPKPLFTAKDASGKAQPITSAPILGLNRNVTTTNSNSPNLLVMFGTGKFLEASDASNTSDVMTYYSVWDKGSKERLRSHLVSRKVVSSAGLRTVEGADIDWTSDFGWYMDMVNRPTAASSGVTEGERVVSDSLLRRTTLFFNTIIPDDTPCKAGGSGWLMSLQYDTGLKSTEALFDANNDGTIDSADLDYVGSQFLNGLPAKSGILGDVQFTPGSDGSITSRKVNVGAGTKEGRLSWEEVYRD